MIMRFTPPRYFFVCRVTVGFGSVKPKLNSSSACTFLSWCLYYSTFFCLLQLANCKNFKTNSCVKRRFLRPRVFCPFTRVKFCDIINLLCVSRKDRALCSLCDLVTHARLFCVLALTKALSGAIMYTKKKLYMTDGFCEITQGKCKSYMSTVWASQLES